MCRRILPIGKTILDNRLPSRYDGEISVLCPGVAKSIKMTSNKLKREFEYYLAHQDELVERYSGKYIVIRNQEVVGEYNDELTAVQESKQRFEPGTFLVQLVSPGDSAYRQTFHSRVAFAE